MNIVIFGAGAIGSLFGSLLSNNNNVTLIGRKNHVKKIKENGLTIKGKTKINVKIDATDNLNKINFDPDLLIITVKSYDTKSAIIKAKSIITEKTIVLSLQNGLDNYEIIKKLIPSKQIILGITTHGAFFSKPGIICHTGIGKTLLGEINGLDTDRIKKISNIFNEGNINTTISKDIFIEIWYKAIINSSINPLTTIFKCKNGYLLKNPILEKIVEYICIESTNIANAHGIKISYQNALNRTKDVIRKTSENYSSMLQSYSKGKRTEIDSINGKLVDIGRIHKIDSSINKSIVYLIKSQSD